VACCDADHAGEWEGEWEECEVVADHGAACDVRIMQGGELCRGVPRRFVRVGVPRSSSASPGGSAHGGRGDKVFGGAAFLVTGLDDDGEKAALLALLKEQGGTVFDDVGGDTALRRLTERAAAGRLVLLSGAKGGGPKTTNKLLVGLALGLVPLAPRWVHDCLRKGEWLSPTPAHRLALRGAPGAAARVHSRVLSGHVVVALGGCVTATGAEWLRNCATVVQAAGAEFRRELPTVRAEGPSQPLCIVLVKRRAKLSAAEDSLLNRARQRGMPISSQDWLEQCLLTQRALLAQSYPF
jgi:hypothetical protein